MNGLHPRKAPVRRLTGRCYRFGLRIPRCNRADHGLPLGKPVFRCRYVGLCLRLSLISLGTPLAFRWPSAGALVRVPRERVPASWAFPHPVLAVPRGLENLHVGGTTADDAQNTALVDRPRFGVWSQRPEPVFACSIGSVGTTAATHPGVLPGRSASTPRQRPDT